jgi:hypothetical protein
VDDVFDEAADSGDIAVENVDTGKFVVLDLTAPSDGHPYCLDDFALGQAAPLVHVHVGEPVCADLGDEQGRAARLDVLVADVGPADRLTSTAFRLAGFYPGRAVRTGIGEDRQADAAIAAVIVLVQEPS